MTRNLSLLCSLAFLLSAAIPAFADSEWSWEWKPAPGDKQPTAAITTFKYGKIWAYAVEIDDGPKWVRSFAAPFLANYHFTDAPPGLAGGKRLPFVGSVAVIVGGVGSNDATVNWDDLKALLGSGWGVINHSFDHRGYGWDDKGKLKDEEISEDAYWSQAILAANLPGGRAPSAVAYANGYTDYNRNDALAKVGIAIATRVGGQSTRDVTSPAVKWMDFTRSYLDEGTWTSQWNKSAPMADFPGGDKDGPPANSLVIDFTHNIDQKIDSPNQKRWITRLKTIEDRWGAGGSDVLWCAPTAEISDYVHAAKAARVSLTPGKITIRIPDNIPGSALTLKINGIGREAELKAPDGGGLYRQGDDVILTTPMIGRWGAAPPEPRLKKIYEGPAVSTDFSGPASIAGITLRYGGCPKETCTCRVALKTAAGVQPFGERTLEGGKWAFGTALCAKLPNKPAITATGVEVQPVAEVRQMTIWAIDDPATQGKDKESARPEK